VLIHFHLHNALLIKKKKVLDIQFYTEVIETSQAVDTTGRSSCVVEQVKQCAAFVAVPARSFCDTLLCPLPLVQT